MCTQAAIKIIAQLLDDVPLRCIGVLRLIDQDVIDLPVKLEPHPVSHIAAAEQLCGLADHIVKVDYAQSVFAFRILMRKSLAD